MNIEYASFPGLGFQGKNLCVMFVFSIVSFLFFFEYQFAVYCARLEFTFGIRALLASEGRLCHQGLGSGL